MIQSCVMGMLLAISVAAAEKDGSAPAASNESLSRWQWRHNVTPAPPDPSPWVDFVLTPEVFGEARADLADLRLVDPSGREVPYALRIRHERHKEEPLEARLFDEQRDPNDRSVAVSVDLGEHPAEHRQVRVETSGDNFRRRVRLETSADNKQWGLLKEDWLVHYTLRSGGMIDQQVVDHPPSRSRYLRVRVSRDLSQPDDAPAMGLVRVYQTVAVPGEYQTRSVAMTPREPVRTPGGGEGSAWTIDLGADQVPCEKLTFEAAEADFARNYVLEEVRPEGGRRIVAQGEWRRRAGNEVKPLEIHFGEVAAHRLRLVVTDDRNPPLTLHDARATAAVRQVVFARREGTAGPLWLYAGNAEALPPHYDFAANLPEVLSPPPRRTALDAGEKNPLYQPAPKPWTERWPWLVYVVLGFASAVLLVLLAALARAAIRRRDRET